ncbi:MAG: hydroxyacid dehydrogenase [Spirochaetes bacterium]|nr:MAG: hydroxyacid dehydrogenase [Spirochaetota bacterium]
MKVLFYIKPNDFWRNKVEELKEEYNNCEFILSDQPAEGILESIEVIVGGKIEEEILEQAKTLKLIIVNFAGVNHLPIAFLKDRGIRVANSHGNARYVAERALAIVMAFYGKIIDYHNDLKEERWHGFWVNKGLNDTWSSLQERSCSILGVGEIGRYLAKYLKVFDCKVTGFRKRKVHESIPNFDEIVYDLDEAIDKGEIIFITLPMTKETEGMINYDVMKKMKNRFLVNVGRGSIVEEEALYRALKEGILLGAGIDCWYNYPPDAVGPPSKYPIHKFPNVVLSPHVAGFTPEAARKNSDYTMQNLRQYLEKGNPVHEVDLNLSY